MPGPEKRPKQPKDAMFSEIVVDMIDDKFALAIINYPDVKKFNGVKVAVYKVADWKALNKNQVDPHFYDDASSPIARFKPDDLGLELAIKMFFPTMEAKERNLRLEMMQTFLKYAHKKRT